MTNELKKQFHPVSLVSISCSLSLGSFVVVAISCHVTFSLLTFADLFSILWFAFRPLHVARPQPSPVGETCPTRGTTCSVSGGLNFLECHSDKADRKMVPGYLILLKPRLKDTHCLIPTTPSLRFAMCGRRARQVRWLPLSVEARLRLTLALS